MRSQIEELEYEKRELQEKVDKFEYGIHEAEAQFSYIKSEADELEDDIASLKSAVDAFGYSDWQSVVPDVESKTSQVDNNLEELQSRLRGFEYDLDQLKSP